MMMLPSLRRALALVICGSLAAAAGATSIATPARAALAVVGVNDSYSVKHDRTTTIPARGVLSNDLNLLGGTSVSLTEGVTHGDLTLRSDGGFTYTPDPGYVGTDSFRYLPSGLLSTGARVTLTVTNVAPVARNDAYSTPSRTTLAVPAPGLLGNDTDADGDALVAELDGGGVSGSLDVNADGSFVYSPGGGFAGIATFTYRVGDGVAWRSATATISVAAPAATPTPTPSPTPTPTPSPTPTPKPSAAPTPFLPLPSLPLPSVPLPLPLPGLASPNPTPRPVPSSTPEPDPRDPSPSPAASSAEDERPSTSPQPQQGGESVGGEEGPPTGGAGGPIGGDGSPSGEGPPIGGDGVPGGLDGTFFPFDSTAAVDMEIGGIDFLANPVWAVPAATIAGPGLLVLLWLFLQAVGAAAWMPSVRRLRGENSTPSR